MSNYYVDWQQKTANGNDTLIPNNAKHAETADLSTKATNDADNNNISTTYAKNADFGDTTTTGLSFYISNQAYSEMTNTIFETLSNWADLSSNVSFVHKTKIIGATIFSGFINNPSGKGNDYWYKIVLPNTYANKNINVFTQPDFYKVGASGSIFTTFVSGLNVGICRDGMSSQSSDGPNARFFIIVYD